LGGDLVIIFCPCFERLSGELQKEQKNKPNKKESAKKTKKTKKKKKKAY